MKLWLVRRNDGCSWDEYDAAVVAAETEEEAMTVCPSDFEWSDLKRYWIPSNLSVEYLGEAKEGTIECLVLSSFNAG